jgi:uncharacterized membrane protein YoaK (UPF0700 family)
MKFSNLKSKLTHQEQMSESFILSAVLAFSGGFQDAYTYIVRDNVFANAQTGNIVLMSTLFMKGQWMQTLRYLFPVIAFALGVFIAENIGHKFKNLQKIHWRQGILLSEILIMIAVGFMPLKFNFIANILVSFSCAMQVQTFRFVGGNAYASTMCIGNLRSGTASLSAYFRNHQRKDLQKVLYYFGVILIFAIGAGIGGVASSYFKIHTIWFTLIPLITGLLLMSLDR